MEDVLALMNLGVFFALVYVIKEVLDSKHVLRRHPYLRNWWLRAALVLVVASQMLLTLLPEMRGLANISFNLGTLCCLGILGFLYHRNTVRIMDYISDQDEH